MQVLVYWMFTKNSRLTQRLIDDFCECQGAITCVRFKSNTYFELNLIFNFKKLKIILPSQ